MKKININLQNSILSRPLSLVDKKHKAFTLAEILLSLTVIGIVAAISLPSLLGNANERAWETQKKALYTRFSQALPLLPSLNGYGELVGNLSDCADTNSCHSDSELKDTAAESFIRDGLSKVMKITNICDNDHLTDCGLPDKIISLNGANTIKLSGMKSLHSYNNIFKKVEGERYNVVYKYEQINTNAAAFETVNGESILVYYNPNCQSNLYENESLNFMQPKMCANFIYDLNGKKGPNTVGKDIGFISALYSTEPSVVAPNPLRENAANSINFATATAKCKEQDENSRLPNVEEAASIAFNKNIIGIADGQYWTSTAYSNIGVWCQSLWTGGRINGTKNATTVNARCIKR